MRDLFPWQTTALEQICNNPRPALFMQMRLGKTTVIIRWALQLDNASRFLVVGPLSVLDDWISELVANGVQRSRITMLTGPMQDRIELAGGGAGWYLINYEGVRILESALSDIGWDAIILDESTAIRNPQAKVTKTLVRLYQDVPYRAILTGDPRPESELDYFEQFRFLLGHFMGFGNYWVFRNVKFRQASFAEWLWQPRPGTRDAVKEFVHSHAVVMTQKQAGIGGRRVYERRVVEMNDLQRQAIKQLVEKFQYEYIQTNFATVRDVWLARVAGGFSPDRENQALLSHAKTDELINLLKGELRREQAVVWFRFNEELEHVVKALNQKKIKTIGVTGATSNADRVDAREAFSRGQYQVICVQVKLGRFGWNLSAASTAIYYSNAYDWESRSQSQERIVHPTKKRPLLYIDLVTRGSLDEEVVRLLREKRSNSASFMRALNASVLPLLMGHHENTKTEKETRRLKAKIRRAYPGTQE